MPEIDPSQVEISIHDHNTLRSLADNIVRAIQDYGSHSNDTYYYLKQAFRLGFTAVGRGEAEGQSHPPLPDFMTAEAVAAEDGFTLGTTVTWTSQANASRTSKTGRIVEIVKPGQMPDRKFRDLWKSGPGMFRNHVSYVVAVSKPGSSAAPKHYWPRAAQLKVVS